MPDSYILGNHVTHTIFTLFHHPVAEASSFISSMRKLNLSGAFVQKTILYNFQSGFNKSSESTSKIDNIAPNVI